MGFKFENGSKMKDKVTGLEGTITGRADYITGCRQYSLQPPLKEGDVPPAVWLDEDRLELAGTKGAAGFKKEGGSDG